MPKPRGRPGSNAARMLKRKRALQSDPEPPVHAQDSVEAAAQRIDKLEQYLELQRKRELRSRRRGPPGR